MQARTIFIHIPRTGGTTIRQLFGWSYQGSPAVLREPRAADLFNQLDHFAISSHADTVKMAMTDAEWASYFKFTFVRNPWDRAVSHYFYSRTISGLVEPGETFSQWLVRRYSEHLAYYRGKSYSVWFRDSDGNMLVDKIYRFENFESEIRDLSNQCSLLSPSVSIPHANQILREHYSVHYDEAAKQLIADLYAEDIKFFGYEF